MEKKLIFANTRFRISENVEEIVSFSLGNILSQLTFNLHDWDVVEQIFIE